MFTPPSRSHFRKDGAHVPENSFHLVGRLLEGRRLPLLLHERRGGINLLFHKREVIFKRLDTDPVPGRCLVQGIAHIRKVVLLPKPDASR